MPARRSAVVTASEGTVMTGMAPRGIPATRDRSGGWAQTSIRTQCGSASGAQIAISAVVLIIATTEIGGSSTGSEACRIVRSRT
jgi:lipid-binding SYLF domain-containing protein